MQRRIKVSKSKNTGFHGTFIFLAAAVCILGFTSAASKGATEGLKISSSIIIPSLFPFTVISIFFEKSGGLSWISRKIEPISKKLLLCSGEDFSVILLSLLGGYPLGGKIANELYKSNRITKNKAQKLLLFSVNPSPAFIISIVGAKILKSQTAGILLFISNTLSCLILNFILNVINKNRNKDEKNTNLNNREISDAFVESVYEGSRTIISICAFVTLFSCIAEIIKPVLNNTSYCLICPFLEISFGINEISKIGLPPYFYSFILSFGGFSTICQLKQASQNISPNFISLFFSRIIHGITATAISFILFKVFPISYNVISNGVKVKFEYPLFAPSIMLLIFAVSFLMYLNSQRYKNCWFVNDVLQN